MRRLALILALCCCTSAAWAATPTLVQHYSVADNPAGLGIDGNAFKFTLPNAVGAGNALVLGVAFCSTASGNCTTTGNDLCHAGGSCTVPVTDSNGNTWPTAPAVRVNDANLNVDMAVFVLPNAAAGVTTITIHFTAALHPMTFDISEFQNVATSSPVDATASNSSVSAPTVTQSITTVASGDLVWVMAIDDSNAGSLNAVTTWAPTGSFKLLEADIGWAADANAHKASAYLVAGAGGAVTAGFTATMTTNDQFAIVVVALKSAAAGTGPPAGIYVKNEMGNTNENPPSSWAMQFPSEGNLLVMVTSTIDDSSHLLVSGITDNKGNTWTRATSGSVTSDDPSIWYAVNATPGNDLKVTLSTSCTSPPCAGTSFIMYDILNAATAPVDVIQGTGSATSCNGTTSLTNFPSLTPTTSNGITIAAIQLGQGPGLATTAPANATFDLTTYTGETDTDTMSNADGRSHFYNPNLSAENWGWTITSQASNSCSGTAVHFKAAAAGGSTCTRTLMGVGC
jgi:hypothetical protein